MEPLSIVMIVSYRKKRAATVVIPNENAKAAVNTSGTKKVICMIRADVKSTNQKKYLGTRECPNRTISLSTTLSATYPPPSLLSSPNLSSRVR